ncbi:MAG: TIGR04552 family protein [Xanthomonadaceae bacterium]|nr:TIGR04552 family protein [Xanthomonadaceae bacterium]
MKLEQIIKKYDFSAEVFDVLIRGKSIIDTQKGLSYFPMKKVGDVDRFMESYGLDLSDPIAKAEILGNYREALAFVKRYFLQPDSSDGLKLEIPKKITELTDIRDLFLMTSLSLPGQQNDSSGMNLRNWACSLLRVVHTIVHIDKDVRAPYISEIQKQIFDRFYKFIHRDELGQLYLGTREDDPSRVDLFAFETKPKKPRDSILLKLLHKPENVAEELFDRVGLRFITQSPLDALRVVKFLKDEMVIMPANIKPSRSRNTLVDLEALENEIETLKSEQLSSDDHWRSRLNLIIEQSNKIAGENPHTSEHYRSLQFTCRQLIQFSNPLYSDLREIKQLSKSGDLSEAATKIADRMDLKFLQKEVRFFYPYEIQIVDHENHAQNEKGRSAHSEYKKAQVLTAMKRVMRNLLEN